MKKNILILKQICKCIQKKTVLNQFYMNIQNGEIVNLIGMEDSGKEDVFSILFGQEKIDSGEIVFNRRSYTQMSQRTFGCRNGEILGIYDVQNKFSRELRRTLLGRRFYNGSIRIGGKEYQAEQEYGAVRSGLGIIDGSKYQDHIFEELTILENIELPIYKKNARKRMFVNSRVTEYIRQKENEFLDLKKSNIQDKAIGLTRGEAMRLIFHRWLWVNPKVICCFQPFLRLDVESREFLYRIFLEFAHKGTGVIISSANVADLTPICDRIIEIDGNKIKESVEKSYFPDMFQN